MKTVIVGVSKNLNDTMEKRAKQNSFLYRVRERFILNCKLRCLHISFSWKYPVERTDPVEWLKAYNIYLGSCTIIREDLNAL